MPISDLLDFNRIHMVYLEKQTKKIWLNDIYFRIWIYNDNKNWYLLFINFFLHGSCDLKWTTLRSLCFSISWQSSSNVSSLSNCFPELQFLATPLDSPWFRPSPQKDHRTSTRRWYCYGSEYVTNRLWGHHGGHHHTYYCRFVSPSVDRVCERVLSNISTAKIYFLLYFQLWVIIGAGEMFQCAKCLWCKHNAGSFILRTHVKTSYGTMLRSPALGRQNKANLWGFLARILEIPNSRFYEKPYLNKMK